MSMSKMLHLPKYLQNMKPGTQNVEGAVGLSAAIDYLNNIGMDKVQTIEKELTNYALEELQKLAFVTIYGSGEQKILRHFLIAIM